MEFRDHKQRYQQQPWFVLRKKKSFLAIIILVLIFCIFFYQTHSDTVQWFFLPEYLDATMEGYVYLTKAENDDVYISYTVYYDNIGFTPVLFNETGFFQGINQILNPSSASIQDDLICQPESSTYYRSSVTSVDVYSGNDKQIEELQEYVQKFDYQFALRDEKTADYAYKLNRNFTLTVVIDEKTAEN